MIKYLVLQLVEFEQVDEDVQLDEGSQGEADLGDEAVEEGKVIDTCGATKEREGHADDDSEKEIDVSGLDFVPE